MICSIIIPVYNRADLTAQCLGSLANTVSADQVEVIVVDNASTDGTRQLLADVGLHVITNERNLGFAAACNQGARAARGELLLFLNNDTVLKPGWLEPLLHVLATRPDVVAVGPRLLLEDGRLQHAGVESVMHEGTRFPLSFRNRYASCLADYPPAMVPGPVSALTAAALLVRRGAFEAVGGYDEGYWNGYEDVDLCLKLREHGLLWYEPTSCFTHLESASGPERWTRVPENVERLNTRWAHRVQADYTYRPDGSRADLVARPPRPMVEGLSSIVIVAYGGLRLNKVCIESVLEAGGVFELILVDNGSVDGTAEYFAELAATQPFVRAVLNGRNLGFAAANNQGMALAQGDAVVVLNNDTVVTRGWLEAMRKALFSRPSNAAVGPISNYVAGPQRMQDVPVRNDPDALEEIKAWSQKVARHSPGAKVELARLIGFCMMIRAEAVELLGGFDPCFGLGYYEDDDLCLRWRVLGMTMEVTQDVYVHHFGSQTFRLLGIDRRPPWADASGAYFLRKWRMEPSQELPGAWFTEMTKHRRHPHAFHEDLPRPDDPAWFPPGEAFAPTGPCMDLDVRPGATTFLVQPRWLDGDWAAALLGYVRAFRHDEPVSLVVWSDPREGVPEADLPGIFQTALESVGLTLDQAPDILVLTERLNREQLAQLYRACDVVVPGSYELDAWRARRSGCKLLAEPLETSSWRAFVYPTERRLPG